ncbi:unnamed protein product, partial [Effrenium voratum]
FFGVTFLVSHEGWSAATAFYVVVQIVTTIGYGDITIEHGGKIFMTVYVLLGTIIVAKIVNDGAEHVLHSASRRVDESLHHLEHAFTARLYVQGFFVATWVWYFVLAEGCSCSYGHTRVEGCEEVRCLETNGVTKSTMEAIYMAVTTFSTVGFGDYSPSSRLGRVLGSIWMILGVLSFADLVSAVGEVLSAHQRYYRNKLRLLRQGLDPNGDGVVDRAEFKLYMLLRQGRVSVDQLDALDRIFTQMDVDGTGRLSFQEILGRRSPKTGWASLSGGRLMETWIVFAWVHFQSILNPFERGRCS